MISRKMGRFVALLGMVALACGVARAADLQELVRETQKTVTADGQITMVWWMPAQFWDESLKANTAITEEVRTQVLGMLADYTIIAMLRAEIGAAGLDGVKSKAELIENARLEIGGTVLAPLEAEEISPDVQQLLTQLKPAMGAMAGAVGGSLEFIVYLTSAEGRASIDAAQPGELKVSLYDQAFRWRLPLGSLQPVRVDAKTGEEFPGNYLFNPFTGDRLTTR